MRKSRLSQHTIEAISHGKPGHRTTLQRVRTVLAAKGTYSVSAIDHSHSGEIRRCIHRDF